MTPILTLVLVLGSGIAIAEKIVIPMDPYPPWKFVETQTWQVNNQGIDVRLIEALLAAYNESYDPDLQAEYIGCPWKRCLEMMRTGEADLISGILKRPERESYLRFIEPPYKTNSTKVFYVKRGADISIQDYDDLYQFMVGTQAGVKYFERFDTDSKIEKEEVTKDLSNFMKLAHGRIDAVISTETQADYLLAINGLQDKFEKADFQYDADLPVYFAISRKSDYFTESSRFAELVSRLTQQGAFQVIIDNYFAELR
ncbi:MAG: transporter substrate-binding domain-containing protein [Candidatus Competibacteraceae bacterium]|nr:transporter substrate-binding domain-containing protein [Candidatus Competibacteraceae bacterium]